MRRRTRLSRGYSLPELLTVVAIMGIVALVTLPAFMQLLPQYRIRAAASEMTASLRMLRQKAAGTRTNWRMTIDPVGERYALARLSGATWIQIGANGRPTPSTGAGTGINVEWMALRNADITAASSASVIMTRDGSAAAAATIVLATNSTRVKYNRYTITVAPSGNVTTVASKV